MDLGVSETIAEHEGGQRNVDEVVAVHVSQEVLLLLELLVLLVDVVAKDGGVATAVRLSGNVEVQLVVLGELGVEELHEGIEVDSGSLCGRNRVTVSVGIPNVDGLVNKDHVGSFVPSMLVDFSALALVDNGTGTKLEDYKRFWSVAGLSMMLRRMPLTKSSGTGAARTAIGPEEQGVFLRRRARLKEPKEKVLGIADIEV